MKKNFKKAAALWMTCALVIGGSTLATMASGPMTEYTFGKREICNEDTTLSRERNYDLPLKSIYRVEKGATLTIDTNFKVFGTFKNYGTIIIRGNQGTNGRQESTYVDSDGFLSIYGNFENHGTILIDNGSMEVAPGGIAKNNGEIYIYNETEDHTVLLNRSQGTQVGALAGEFYNKKSGKIYIDTTIGTGLQNQIGATLVNDGHIYLTETSIMRGTYTGNEIEGFHWATK